MPGLRRDRGWGVEHVEGEVGVGGHHPCRGGYARVLRPPDEVHGGVPRGCQHPRGGAPPDAAPALPGRLVPGVVAFVLDPRWDRTGASSRAAPARSRVRPVIPYTTSTVATPLTRRP